MQSPNNSSLERVQKVGVQMQNIQKAKLSIQKGQTRCSRLATYFERLYDGLNERFFSGVLDRPAMIMRNTSRAYIHYSFLPFANADSTAKREINIGAGTLDGGPVEHVVAMLLREMVHQYNNEIANMQDCSRGGTYRNHLFRDAAELHGLTVAYTTEHGWTVTGLSMEALQWMQDNGIQKGAPVPLSPDMPCSAYISPVHPVYGYRYVCPSCHNTAHSSEIIGLVCGRCMTVMQIEGRG